MKEFITFGLFNVNPQIREIIPYSIFNKTKGKYIGHIDDECHCTENEIFRKVSLEDEISVGDEIIIETDRIPLRLSGTKNAIKIKTEKSFSVLSLKYPSQIFITVK